MEKVKSLSVVLVGKVEGQNISQRLWIHRNIDDVNAINNYLDIFENEKGDLIIRVEGKLGMKAEIQIDRDLEMTAITGRNI